MTKSKRWTASKRFWETQVVSRHRDDSDEFYRLKAREHAALLSEKDRSVGIVDLGCGAGELLAHFARYATVEAALDYSESMLDRARQRLDGRGIELILEPDICTRMAQAKYPAWIACGSVNQYLDERAQRRLLTTFARNARATSLYYFDCVDPIRYAVRNLGCDYLATGLPSVRAIAAFAFRTARQILSGDVFRAARWLGSESMGWGYLPYFWRRECARLDLHVEFVSSAMYEYRYHVMVRKIA